MISTFSAGADAVPLAPAAGAGSSEPQAAADKARAPTATAASSLPRRVLFIIPDPSQVVPESRLGAAPGPVPDNVALR
ncbi:hypothetical protein Aple_043700 [Acrocarpospora pleiomorpha]|uniref:Uncharacterized protein n=1 Tax=Acrocarpospora pleiomorpha TaxID=90975 RepID=A0A5M3XJN6_9ACTN|nr:hypothetical protein Aple_043700 [Acrocarpospora pleiomorpha]